MCVAFMCFWLITESALENLLKNASMSQSMVTSKVGGALFLFWLGVASVGSWLDYVSFSKGMFTFKLKVIYWLAPLALRAVNDLLSRSKQWTGSEMGDGRWLVYIKLVYLVLRQRLLFGILPFVVCCELCFRGLFWNLYVAALEKRIKKRVIHSKRLIKVRFFNLCRLAYWCLSASD